VAIKSALFAGAVLAAWGPLYG